MEFKRFDEPVYVFVGLGFLTRVETVSRAFALLTEMPARHRGAAHAVALHACWAAFRKEVEAETVRSAFIKYAEATGMLAPTVEPLIADPQAKGTGISLPH